MTVYEVLQLMLATANFVVLLIGLVVALIKLSDKK